MSEEKASVMPKFDSLAEACQFTQNKMNALTKDRTSSFVIFHRDPIIEPPTHHLIRDKHNEVVFTYSPKPYLVDHLGYFSLSTYAKMVDNLPAVALLSKSDLRLSVTLSLDIKQFKPMKIDEPVTLLTRIVTIGEVYSIAEFEGYNSQGELLNIGTHTKVFSLPIQKL